MKKVFVVHDSKAEAYGMPMFMDSTGVAMRSFTDEVNRTDGQSMVAQHPEDFTLFEIGQYDEQKGEWYPNEIKKSLCVGVDVKRNPETLAQAEASGRLANIR